MNIRRRLLTALLLLITITALSVLGYRLLGGQSVGFLQALYMTVITLAGVGYSEVVDTSRNPGLRMFNMLVVFCGVTISVYVFSVVTAFLLHDRTAPRARSRRWARRRRRVAAPRPRNPRPSEGHVR